MLDFFIVSALGIAVGAAELAARYRDAPARALKTFPGVCYLALNGATAAFTLVLVRLLGLDLTLGDDASGNVPWLQIFVSGFGAMGLLRSSFFKLRAADREVDIGPAALLDLLFDLIDRAVDRERARGRAREVAKIMTNVSYAKAAAELPVLCLTLMQNLPKEDQESLGEDLNLLEETEMGGETKALILGLKLMNHVGPAVLEAAVETLGEKIQHDTPVLPPAPPT